MSTENQNAAAQPAQQPAATTQAVVVAPKREIRTVEDNTEISYLMDTARFEHCYRIAGAMARASLIPKHLKGDSFEQTQANCFLIVNQAMRWQLDPFAIAPETYEVGGKLGFQGKLVAAVINARAGLVEKLSYAFNDAKGDALEVTVSGKLKGEDTPRTVTVSVAQAKTSNQMWTKDPHQKLIYTGATKWARRHAPEVILGVLTDDDAEQIREEMRVIAAKPAKRPDFGQEAPRQIAEQASKTSQDAPQGVSSQSEASESSATQPAPASAQEQAESSTVTPPQAPQESKVTRAPFAPRNGATDELNNVLFLAHRDEVAETQVIAWAKSSKIMKTEQKDLAELSTQKLTNIGKSWDNIVPEIRKH